MNLSWRWLGRVGYADAFARQRRQREAVLAGDDSAQELWLLEHEPVITLGRAADRRHIVASATALAEAGIEVVESDRGGDVTYHGPGQLVVYPIVRVRGGVVAFLSAVAGALAEVASDLGVPGCEWRRSPAGLWLGAAKIAACGVHLRRGVSIHGWALNLTTPPDVWRLIVPCGLNGARVTSVAEQRGEPPPPIDQVAAAAAGRVCAALGRAPLELLAR